MTDTTTHRAIGPLGTLARGLLGTALTVVTFVWIGVSWWDVAAAIVVLPLLAVAATGVFNRILPAPEPEEPTRTGWSNRQIALTIAVLVTVVGLGTALTFASAVDGGAIYIFLGVSTVLAAVRGDSGCEVLSIPKLVLRDQESIWCPVYSPLDDAEARAASQR